VNSVSINSMDQLNSRLPLPVQIAGFGTSEVRIKF
jgi:hypothetical protein